MLAGLAAAPAITKLEVFIPVPDSPPVYPEELLRNLANEMSYRLGLTLNYLVKITYDGSAVDPLMIEKFSQVEYLLPEAA